LIFEKNGVQIGRAVIEKHEDNSLSFAGNIKEGTEVCFGHGNVDMILKKSAYSAKNLLNLPVEGIFIYSCMARKALLGDNIDVEILPFKQIAPMCGFFTNGEFFHDSKNKNSKTRLLNETMTVLALSESKALNKNKFLQNKRLLSKKDILNINRMEALSHLITQTTEELENLSDNLQEKVETEVQKNVEKDQLVNMLQAQAQMGSMMEMILHQWRQPINGINVIASGLQLQQDMTDLPITKDEIYKSTNSIIELIEHLNDTIDDFRDFYNPEQRLSKISPKSLINKVKTIFESLLKKNKIKIIENFQCDKYEPQNLLFIPVGQILQVLSVLIKNSIDVLQERDIKNPTIYITFISQKDSCILQIEDNAKGIPDEIQDKIFERRFTTKKNTHGTGIGLDICKKIIETNLKGTITASNSNKGAVFTINIPKIIKT
jgi:signal transduction histidine kinase